MRIKKIGVLGCGNMGQALSKGIHNRNRNFSFLTYTPSKIRALELAIDIEGTQVSSLEELAKCDLIILACKPQQFESVASELKPFLKDQIILSVLAGTNTSQLENGLNKNIIRYMPNTPIGIGLGAGIFYFSNNIEMNIKSEVLSLFAKISTDFEVQTENEFDSMMVITGCGPAYIYEFAKYMSEFLIDKGISKQSSVKAVKSLFTGASELMNKSDEELDSLIGKVTSKGGVTIEAIESFRESNIQDSFNTAFEKALKRSLELSNNSN
ncbi:MAG: pyrroline-5-carboxylate reductase [Thermoproteota archaeon]|jgi:pyrroline-5-carboxylate reductase